ncbi:class I SAM-dependent methyltransferase [Gryllotalpicola reticulitermitis]|uniref:Class I SAM-dependent methyltransferase n=1 Tax=Gryllotalpicola reticulitermitis TaxID=1184153 RepID=A0ABV8Q0N3_9MICO
MATDVGGVWNRDAAYHPWIVRIAAEHAGDVLDVGCGDGLLVSRLAEVSRSVVGIDRDAAAIAQAQKRLSMVPRTDAVDAEFSSEWGLAPDTYDVITMVSVLHELPLVPTLERAASLLKPGGTLLIVGQTRPETWLDHALQTASTAYSRPLETFYSWRGRYRPEFQSASAVAPSYSLADVADAAALLLPGAALRRGLLGRYTLRWSKPAPIVDAVTGPIAVDADVAVPFPAAGTAPVPAAATAHAVGGAAAEDHPSALVDADQRSTSEHLTLGGGQRVTEP